MHPKINYLAQSYFHQDFDLEADSPIGVVEKFRDQEPPETTEILIREIASVLASNSSEACMESLWINEAGACYDPREDGISVRDWLSRVMGALAQ